MNRFLLIFLALSLAIYGQDKKDIKALETSAETKLKAENYEEALDDYLQLLTIDSKSELYNYNAGVCYLNSNINKSKAVPYLQIVTRREKYNPNADFLLGRAYQYANRYDEAIASFEKFKASAKGSEQNLAMVEQEIQHCINAKELIKYPVDVIFQPLGKSINSEYADYYPFVTENEAYMIFNSRRPVSTNTPRLDNGQYANSIFVSKIINGVYSEANVLGEPISKGNSGEEIIGMNAKGDLLLIYKTDYKGSGKIYLSKMDKSGDFSKPEALPAPINGVGDQISACISNDGKTIYFASDRPGGFGGTDIYTCQKQSDDKWSEPKNMGIGVNTPFDEDFPNLSPDGTMFYFSSKGHASMGGYDIFKSQLDPNTGKFINPRNMGYPVNTSYDDMNFRISKSGKYGYLASVRGGGMGDYDIYRISFNDDNYDYTVLIGQVGSRDNSEVPYRDVFITINDNVTNQLVGSYVPNPVNGRFIIMLPAGKYILNAEAPGFKSLSVPIEIRDKASYQSEKNLFIELHK